MRVRLPCRARILCLASLLIAIATNAGAGDPGAEAVRAAVRTHIEARDKQILQELIDLLSIPNRASDQANIRKNADLLEAMLRKRGISTRRLVVRNAPPVVFGELGSPGAKHTLVLYAHYDGQPVDPTRWTGDPWRPAMRDPSAGAEDDEIAWWLPEFELHDEWRLYGRSASDDKAPIVALLAAIDALQGAHIPLSVNLKFFLEGEEEAGSPHLRQVLETFISYLEADLWLMCDGPVHQSRRMQVFYGARGVLELEMTVYGSPRPLHSGHYGNWAPNPIATLIDLLDSMRDSEGRVLMKGFSDEVRRLTRGERRALERIPDLASNLKEELALGRTEGDGRRLEELLMRPAMNLRGIRAGNVGEKAQNAIPTEARASIDFRLVPDQTPDSVRTHVEAHLRRQGFHIIYDAPDPAVLRTHPRIVRLAWGSGYPPARAPLDLPASRGLVRVISEAAGDSVVELPTLGGSVPLYLFRDVLHTPAIGVPIVNHDNNQHAADENLRLRNLWDGIGIFASIFSRLGHVWSGADSDDS
jgi:acetylornithine deacetylase/succinyl-diaminopimelate desuccinylase-like protein